MLMVFKQGLNGIECTTDLSLEWTIDWRMIWSYNSLKTPYLYKVYGSRERISPPLYVWYIGYQNLKY